jgi:hypothetical protein
VKDYSALHDTFIQECNVLSAIMLPDTEVQKFFLLPFPTYSPLTPATGDKFIQQIPGNNQKPLS